MTRRLPLLSGRPSRPNMQEGVTAGRWRFVFGPRARTALYEGAVALAGWAALAWCTRQTWPAVDVQGVLLFLGSGSGLEARGPAGSEIVTHSLAGVAVVGSLMALGPCGGAWVAALAGALSLCPVSPRQPPTGWARWRLILFGSGLCSLVALGSYALYWALGGPWSPTALRGADLVPLLAICLAWFLGDHLGWSLRFGCEEGLHGLRRFVRRIRSFSLLVELVPLPVAWVLAMTYRVSGNLGDLLLAGFLSGPGTSAAAERDPEPRPGTSGRPDDLNRFSRALLTSKCEVTELCRLLEVHTARSSIHAISGSD